MASQHPLPPFSELKFHPSARHVRGLRDGDTVVDSIRAVLIWEPGKRVPVYAFPREDVAPCADASGNGSSPLTREVLDEHLRGYVIVGWGAADHWFEEDEEIFVHPRDPFVRVDALRSSRHVRVERDGRVLAESDSPILVFETGLPTRYYLPAGDVDASLLEGSDLETGCPYKGFARYYHVTAGGQRYLNLFWYYPHPFREAVDLVGHIAPYNERVDLFVGGELQERPGSALKSNGQHKTGGRR
jgi:uncharacterized protein (DUF427 family)